MIFVIDGILGIWSALRDYTFGISLSSIDAIFDSTPSEPVIRAGPDSILIALAWVAAIAIPGVSASCAATSSSGRAVRRLRLGRSADGELL